MVLTPCSDVSPAAWLTDSALPWQQLVTLGPDGFAAYARLRFLPDPNWAGQPEATIDANASSTHERLRAAVEVLRQHTRTPDDCYYCLWDGWIAQGPDEDALSFPLEVGDGPKVVIPHRAYVLFHGSLTELGEWGVAERTPGYSRPDMPDPAFIWPADRAWCVTNDVDAHYAGIGASAAAIARILTDPDLDVVPTGRHEQIPHYR